MLISLSHVIPFAPLGRYSAHSPTFPSLHLRHSSLSNPSVAPPASQLILQPFFRFTYVTWRAAHDCRSRISAKVNIKEEICTCITVPLKYLSMASLSFPTLRRCFEICIRRRSPSPGLQVLHYVATRLFTSLIYIIKIFTTLQALC